MGAETRVKNINSLQCQHCANEEEGQERPSSKYEKVSVSFKNDFYSLRILQMLQNTREEDKFSGAHCATKKSVQNDPTAPDVNLRACIKSAT